MIMGDSIRLNFLHSFEWNIICYRQKGDFFKPKALVKFPPFGKSKNCIKKFRIKKSKNLEIQKIKIQKIKKFSERKIKYSVKYSDHKVKILIF